MTREEAIKDLITMSEILVSESKQNISANEALDKIRALMPCFDTIIPLLKEPKWHKVSEEGFPTEEGLYNYAYKVKDTIEYDQVYMPSNDPFFQRIDYTTSKESQEEVRNYLKSILVAWQKMTPYKEG